jgi:hypothetical protein
MPPARYELRSTSGLRVSGRVTVLFGRADVPIAETNLQDVPPGVLPLSLDLPAGATRLRVTADAAAARTIGELQLRLVAPSTPSRNATPRYASRVLRSAGGATAWFVDENAFVEPGGFWVRGGEETTVIVDGGGRSAELLLRAGPVATVCEVGWAGDEIKRLPLSPERVETVSVPPGLTVVRVGSTEGFRPRDHDPRSPDARWLGVRVELP